MIATKILLHHSAGIDTPASDWEGIRADHLRLGYNDIGYHRGLELVGGVPVLRIGRPLNVMGAHCRAQRMNHKSIGFVIVGNFELSPPNPIILPPLVGSLVWLCQVLNIPASEIGGHGDYANTLCPGKYFPMEYVRDVVDFKLKKGRSEGWMDLQ